MLLGEPPRNQYDLHFSCFGFPVRISVYFWLAAGLLGAMRLRNSDSRIAGVLLMSWVVSMFISILIHELGHAFAMRYFGSGARIVLYMMGGLAIPDSFGFGTKSYGRESNRTVSQIIISLAGPFAGFALAGITIGLVYATRGAVTFAPQDFPFFWDYKYAEGAGLAANVFFQDMLFINIFWGMLNLLPIYPLDGGQVSRELFVANDYRGGIEKSLWLSVYTAGAIVVWGLYMASKSKDGSSMFTVMMFGSLAYSSYQAIQQLRGGGFGGGRPI